MAGGSSSEDNPVALNVTAMVDIIFCLCLFFMCSFHFKQLQGKLDTWLPKDQGPSTDPSISPIVEELRVVLRHEPDQGGAVLRFGGRSLGLMSGPGRAAALEEMTGLLLEGAADHERLGRSKVDVPVIIDASPLVPWADVIAVMNACQVAGLARIEFAAPLPAPAEH